MLETEFFAMLRRLNEYYGLEKIISPGRAQQWFLKCKDIPAEALAYIQTAIENSADTLPRNMPKAIRGHYNQWRNENSARMIKYGGTCEECRSRGFLFARRRAIVGGIPAAYADGRRMYEEVTYRCAMCENWRNFCHQDAMPAATRQDIVNWGFKLLRTGE
jgi:hypothetical protein